MKIFITGTDTNIGKTMVSSWLCLHSQYDYFKPIQTGCEEDSDSHTVATLAGCHVHPEIYRYPAPLSPHLAAKLAGDKIQREKLIAPSSSRLIIEGAGGLLVPIHDDFFMIDLIKQVDSAVILVSSSKLGTINHTLLSLEALNKRDIAVLGVIVNGDFNQDNCDAIEFYAKTRVLAQLPRLQKINREALQKVALTKELKDILR